MKTQCRVVNQAAMRLFSLISAGLVLLSAVRAQHQAGSIPAAPRIHDYGLLGTNIFWLAWTSAHGLMYEVERTTNLAEPFAALAKNLPATVPVNTFTDTVNSAAAAYRVATAEFLSVSNWIQHARDAQRTGYAPAAPPPPWRWAWQWNGSDAQGRIVPGKILLPRNVQPILAEGRVYIACGTNGVVCLDEQTGAVVWQVRLAAAVNSTLAYDPVTRSLFTVCTNGRLYKLNPSDGSTVAECGLGQPSNLPLPPAVIPKRIFASMGRQVIALDPQTLQTNWVYDAGSTVHTPPAYSAKYDRVIVCTADLHVHAINNADGSRRWRVKPSVHAPGSPYEYAYGWPVIAEQHGIVLVRQRNHWDLLWTNPNPFGVPDNATIRSRLASQPMQRCHFALRLSDGSVAFDINNGQGGFGDGGYLPIGSMPIIRTFPDGTEIALQIIRGDNRYDARWDSHFGEMMLDSETVSGLQAGDVRWIRHGNDPSDDAFLLTDEQPFLSAAGDYLFGSHWLVTYALHVQDRTPKRGTFANKIATTNLPWFIVSQGACGPCKFSPTHYCPEGLREDPTCGRYYAGGFYVCFNQGAVHDKFWTEYGCVISTPQRLVVRDTSGAIFSLVHGNPYGALNAGVNTGLQRLPHTNNSTNSMSFVTVAIMLGYVFNNGKMLLLASHENHRGSFKAIIPNSAWKEFPGLNPALGRNVAGLYREGQIVAVKGELSWYQGDEAIYVTASDQLQVLQGAHDQEARSGVSAAHGCELMHGLCIVDTAKSVAKSLP